MLTKACIYLIKNKAKTVILCNIITFCVIYSRKLKNTVAAGSFPL